QPPPPQKTMATQTPVAAPATPVPPATPVHPAFAPAPPAEGEGAPRKKVDLRTLRRTGRTFPVNTKIKPEAGEKLTRIAQESGLSLAEVIERFVSQAR